MARNDPSARTRSVFEMTRVFKAPRNRIWKAWSEADQLLHWWGPKGCEIEVASLEFMPGGFFHYSMKFEGAPTMWGRFNYRQIVAAERIVWLNSFANENCGIARAPFSEFCPLEIENTVTFMEHAGTTTIALQVRPFGETVEERTFFDELCSSGSLEEGNGGTFEKLAKYVAEA
jgi:uncharacterized protein YndB with AHSA1/START domain